MFDRRLPRRRDHHEEQWDGHDQAGSRSVFKNSASHSKPPPAVEPQQARMIEGEAIAQRGD
jgi:hypothetical protein